MQLLKDRDNPADQKQKAFNCKGKIDNGVAWWKVAELVDYAKSLNENKKYYDIKKEKLNEIYFLYILC